MPLNIFSHDERHYLRCGLPVHLMELIQRGKQKNMKALVANGIENKAWDETSTPVIYQTAQAEEKAPTVFWGEQNKKIDRTGSMA